MRHTSDPRNPLGSVDPLAALWAGATGACLLLLPLAGRATAFLPPCPTRRVLGWPCPGCGSGRALTLAAEGRIVEAYLFAPLSSLAGAAFLLGGLFCAFLIVRKRPLALPSRRELRRLRVELALLIVLGWSHVLATGL